MKTSNAGKDVVKENCSCIAGRNVKLWSYSPSALSNETKGATMIQPSNCTPGHLPQSRKNLCSLKTCTTTALLHNCHKLETTQICLMGEWWKKKKVWYIYSRKYYLEIIDQIILYLTFKSWQPGWISREVCWVKKIVNPWRVQAAWFHVI